MKKLLMLAFTIICINAAMAQILKTDGRLKLPIKVKPTVIENHTCGNYPETNITVEVTVEDAGAQGYQVKFSSASLLEKVEVSRSQPNQVLNTLILTEGSKAGAFFMDSGAYKGSNSYVLTFYSPRKVKCVWVAAIQRKVD